MCNTGLRACVCACARVRVCVFVLACAAGRLVPPLTPNNQWQDVGNHLHSGNVGATKNAALLGPSVGVALGVQQHGAGHWVLEAAKKLKNGADPIVEYIAGVVDSLSRQVPSPVRPKTLASPKTAHHTKMSFFTKKHAHNLLAGVKEPLMTKFEGAGEKEKKLAEAWVDMAIEYERLKGIFAHHPRQLEQMTVDADLRDSLGIPKALSLADALKEALGEAGHPDDPVVSIHEQLTKADEYMFCTVGVAFTHLRSLRSKTKAALDAKKSGGICDPKGILKSRHPLPSFRL